MLQALEELALNYDRKVQIAEDKSKELLQTSEELSEKNVSIKKFLLLVSDAFVGMRHGEKS